MIPDLTPTEIARFRSKLVLAGCGVRWRGPVNNKGYGRFEIYRDGKRVRILAHRLAYRLATGLDPGDALIRHGCDTPPCCTPDCLEPGTQADNMRDAVERGRAATEWLLIPHVQRALAVQQRIASGRKRCSKCKDVKAMDEFSRHSGNADGRQYECKACLGDRNASAVERARMNASHASCSH